MRRRAIDSRSAPTSEPLRLPASSATALADDATMTPLGASRDDTDPSKFLADGASRLRYPRRSGTLVSHSTATGARTDRSVRAQTVSRRGATLIASTPDRGDSDAS